MAHVQVVTVQPTTLTRVLRLDRGGRLQQFPHDAGHHAGERTGQPDRRRSRAEGTAGRAHAVRGQSRLFATSHQLSEGQRRLRSGAKGLRSRQDLYEHQAIAEQNLEQAESAEVQAGGDLAAAQAALKVMGITDPDALVKAPPSFEVPVRAPISGEVVEQDVSAGQLIQPGTTQCFMISDTSNVWVLVNVYQKDLPYVRVGDTVTIQTDAYPDIFHGRISYVAASLDPNTRTLQARIETNNPGEKLKKDMYVVATVNAGTIPECDRAAGCGGAARQREPAFCLCGRRLRTSLAGAPSRSERA